MFKTRMTELLGTTHPIQCGTMQAITRAELVAAVVAWNRGALGKQAGHPLQQVPIDGSSGV